MRIFNVKVNGKVYNVEVDEQGTVSGVGVTAPVAVTTPVALFTPVSAPAPAPEAAKPVVSSVEGGTPVKSPMPGLILKTLVSDGAAVKKNQKIIILEAMKMENDILASADGTVYFTVKKGDSVETGAVLATVK